MPCANNLIRATNIDASSKVGRKMRFEWPSIINLAADRCPAMLPRRLGHFLRRRFGIAHRFPGDLSPHWEMRGRPTTKPADEISKGPVFGDRALFISDVLAILSFHGEHFVAVGARAAL